MIETYNCNQTFILLEYNNPNCPTQEYQRLPGWVVMCVIQKPWFEKEEDQIPRLNNQVVNRKLERQIYRAPLLFHSL